MFLFLNAVFYQSLQYRYNENEILTKVEELRRILSEKEGITSKDKKDAKSKYVRVISLFTQIVLANIFLCNLFQRCPDNVQW